MHLEYTFRQLDELFQRTVWPLFFEQWTNLVAVQNTTTKRAAIMVPQQFRLHKVNI